MTNREVVVERLVKRYSQDVVAVDDISFKVDSGQVFGFLGPNGAGKSTTIKILSSLALPTSGRVTVGGFDVVSEADQVRQIMGVALRDTGVDNSKKPLELLSLQGQLFGMTRWDATSRAGELLELVGLSGAVGRRVGTYSGGMRRRLDLALALVHRPEILFLDEPTTGLDPTSRRALWGEVKRLNRDFGITVFLTTQYLEEADELADVVAIIDKGRIAAMGAPSVLKAGVGPESVNVTFDSREKAGKARSELAGIAQRTQVDDDTVRLYMARAAASVPGVVNRLQGAGIEADSISLTQPTLGDVFLQVTGQRLRVQEDAPAEPA